MSDYLSTVARSGQVNTPPGSYVTVKEWARNSFVNPQSSVLEIGCSTGFISIEMARYTGASCTGIDLHKGSVETARGNVDAHVMNLVTFVQGDAGSLPFEDDSFSHVVISGHLPFAPAEVRRQHVIEALRVLRPWGSLLVGLYYYHSEPPIELVDEFNAKIGTNLTPLGNRAYWSGLFDELLLVLEYDADYAVNSADAARTAAYVARMAPETRSNWKEYLELFNQNGRFLSYFTRVYRKVPNEPGVMLQIPRGGIYTTRRKSGGHV